MAVQTSLGRAEAAVEDFEFLVVEHRVPIDRALRQLRLSGRTMQRHYRTLGRDNYPGLASVERRRYRR